jgi:uncharacterized membrane protein YiaA
MMVLLKPSVVFGTVVVILARHPLRHPHTTRQLHHVLTIAFICTMLLLIEVINSALASSVVIPSSIILALNLFLYVVWKECDM